LPDGDIHIDSKSIHTVFIFSLFEGDEQDLPSPSKLIAEDSMNSVKTSSETAPSWPRIDAAHVHTLLGDGTELAFLDVREEGLFNTGHPLTIVSMPFSHLETRMAPLVPRRATRIVLMDQSDDGLAERCARRLAGWRYTDISILKNGLEGWRQAGLEVFAGIYVPSKAFGEFVEHRYDTPAIDAPELRRWIDQGKDMVILDSRPYSEFHNYSLPGGIDCPGAELVHRVFDLVEREETTIVVNCAGRTRGIIGAQSLINAGIKNPVVCVRNGTAGWHLSGETMARGSRTVAPPPSPKGLAAAIEAAMRVSKRFGVREIDATGLRDLQADPARSLYFFDVRSPEEYEGGAHQGCAQRTWWPAHPVDRPLCRHAQRPHRPVRRQWRARTHDGVVADPARLVGGVRARRRPECLRRRP
jgi:rhodanese-related sulfurtransferase